MLSELNDVCAAIPEDQNQATKATMELRVSIL